MDSIYINFFSVWLENVKVSLDGMM
jgi:hypothetical protein